MKNIILLSDGTGNSAAKPFKTNVWRLYQALDATTPPPGSWKPRQIVFYDEGVGTETLKPLALIGGAIGFGVWTNVKDLYTFVCRNYREGDRIYGFGFSRGAFTIRLLMGMIGRCGLIETKSRTETELLAAVDAAYRAYRRDYLVRASRNRPGMPYHLFLSEPAYAVDEAGRKTIKLPFAGQLFPEIAFVGVWDTVDAYGLPVDALKLIIDRWIWPMTFADRNLSPSICAARHALSLDDERSAFRPVLWNELDAQGKELSPDRIQQVWFAGVHANVGGGYPDDGLAYVSLDWIMSEASAAGLRFLPDVREEVTSRADAHGQYYDSRSGLAGYYAYRPRKVSELRDDETYRVKVPVIRVHTTAFDRIVRRQVDYAPVSLDCAFELAGGSPEEVPDPSFLRPEPQALQAAWAAVARRRLAYYTTVALTLFASLFLLRYVFAWPDRVLAWTETALRVPLRLLAWPIAALADSLPVVTRLWDNLNAIIASVLPSWVVLVLKSIGAYPLSAVISLGLLAWLFFKKSEQLQREVSARAEWAWAAQKGLNR